MFDLEDLKPVAPSSTIKPDPVVGTFSLTPVTKVHVYPSRVNRSSPQTVIVVDEEGRAWYQTMSPDSHLGATEDDIWNGGRNFFD